MTILVELVLGVQALSLLFILYYKSFGYWQSQMLSMLL